MKASLNGQIIIQAFLTLLCFFTISYTNAQNLLNRKADEIKISEKRLGGLLRLDKKAQVAAASPSFDLMVFTFSQITVNQNDTLVMTFFLRKDKCYKYIIAYRDQHAIPGLIHKFDFSNGKFSRVAKTLKWINSSEHYSVEILKQSNSRNDQPPTFTLEIYSNSSE